MKQMILPLPLFEKQLIDVSVDGESVQYLADIFGQYAVHETLVRGWTKDETWTVTHVLSGLAIVRAITNYGDACNLASRLDGRVDCDAYWTAGRCADEAFYEHLNSIVKAWEAHCGGKLGYTLSGARCDNL